LKAREAALKAISLDDQLPTAHDSLGIILERFDYDYVGAEREFKRALELDPNNTSTLESYGLMLSNLGRHEEALAKLRLATEIDPLGFNTSYGTTLRNARRYDEAVAQYKKSLDLDAYNSWAHLGLSIVYQMKGNYAESVEERAKMTERFFSPQAAAFVRESFANGGWQGFLRAMTSNPQAPKVPPYILATFYAELGEKDKAFAILNKLYEDHDFLGSIKVDPRFDSLHDDPRFQDLLRRVGLPQ
jgi:tetratricopeptide (TPR) repeat protein